MIDQNHAQSLAVEGVEQDKPHLMALSMVQGVGPSTQKRVLQYLKKRRMDWSKFWELNNDELKNIQLTNNQINSILKYKSECSICAEYEKLQFREIRVISFLDKEYPPLLNELERAPLVLYARGPIINHTQGLAVAVVGTRDMTSYGKRVTENIVSELVELGVSIISGFMYGIDTVAHQSALKFGGQTVGVVGFGLDHMYPDTHQKVYEQCLADGMTFYSPFSPATQAKPGNFPARNQVVAGMSHAVLVTEAAAKSGSLITAGVAADLGREVFAVPGSIFSSYSEGTRQLVNQGAALINSGYELVDELSWPGSSIQHSPLRINPSRQSVSKIHHPKQFTKLDQVEQLKKIMANLSHTEQRIVKLLVNEDQTFEEIKNSLVIDTTQLTTALNNLELAGAVHNQGNSWLIGKADE